MIAKAKFLKRAAIAQGMLAAADLSTGRALDEAFQKVLQVQPGP